MQVFHETLGAGALDYVVNHPGGSLGDYLGSGCFWRSVGIGLAAGAVAGLVAWAVPFLLPAGSGIVYALSSNFAIGSLAVGAWQGTTNLLTPGRSIGAGVLPAMAAGGLFGAALWAMGYGIGRGIQALAVRRLQGLTYAADQSLRQNPGLARGGILSPREYAAAQ